MKFSLLILSLFLIQSFSLHGQIGGTDDEIDQLSQKLITTLHNKKKVKRVVVADFTYKGQANTRIGKYLADELSNGIMRNGANFSVISREKARPELMAKAKQKDPGAFKDLTSGTIDVLSKDDTETAYEKKKDKDGLIDRAADFFGKMASNKKVLKKRDIIAFGTIEDKGDYLRVLIEMTKNDGKGEAIGGGVGNFIKTQEIRALLQGQVPAAAPPTPSPSPYSTQNTSLIPKSPNNTTEIFKHKNLSFEVVGCAQNGREIECKVNILSTDQDAQLTIRARGTRIIDANGSHEFEATEIKLAGRSIGNGWGNKTLVENISTEATIRFVNVRREIQSIARMEINCYQLIPKLNNIPVN